MKLPILILIAGIVLGTGTVAALRADPTAPPPPPAITPAPADGNETSEVKLVDQFGSDGDRRLDATERAAARAFLAQHPAESAPKAAHPGQTPMILPLALEPVKPGAKVAPGDVVLFSDRPFYAPEVIRTLFLQFDDPDWEKDLTEFARTDVLVPGRLTMDGADHPGVGVHYLPQVAPLGPGYKRSLEISLARPLPAGVNRLILLGVRTDTTFLRSMLYYRIAHEYLPAPAANFVRLVINGEDWGIYTSVQPLDENFVQESFGTPEGARWVATGGNLAYLGEELPPYLAAYRLLSPEDPAAWAALIRLCRTLKQTPPDQLTEALAPLLDVDGALKFLALENALINQDGYGSVTNSYGLYLDPKGVFHLVPQLAETSFRLVQVYEYNRSPQARRAPDSGEHHRGGGHGSESGHDSSPANGKEPAGEPGQTASVKKAKEFPQHSTTDLAMMLSYSMVNKADTDFDRILTKDEWLDFSRSWFVVMDEDMNGQLSHDQFITKVRLLVTPLSVIDGRTTQTFGSDDPAGIIGESLLKAMDANHDGQLTMEEFTATFTVWFAAWSDVKTGRLTEEGLRNGLISVFPQVVFQADQTYIASKPTAAAIKESEERGGHGGRGHGGGGEGGGGSGLNLGPLNLGMIGLGHGNAGGSSLITFGEQLDPLAGFTDNTKPLLNSLLAVTSLRLRYLDDVRDIAETWLTWSQLGPIAEQYHALIRDNVAKDTHKPSTYAHFVQDLDQDTAGDGSGADDTPSLRSFVTTRHAYLLENANP